MIFCLIDETLNKMALSTTQPNQQADDFLIRPFEPRDQDAVSKLILEGLGEHFGFIDETLNPDLADIMKCYIIPGHTFLVAYIGSNLVGTGALIRENEGSGRIVRVST